MFKIETVKVDPKLYSTHAKYEKLYPTEAAAIHLVDSQGKYTNIGSGAFGTVYGCHNTNIVYKVGDVDCNTAYMSYVRELSRLKTPNKFLPTIYGCRIFKHRGDSHFVVAMERLIRGSGDPFYSAVSQFQDFLENDSLSSSEPDMLGIQQIVPEPLIQALTVVKRAYNHASAKSGGDVRWDLHRGNFMLRGKNEIVITDPIA
jgi:hypothetical protein